MTVYKVPNPDGSFSEYITLVDAEAYATMNSINPLSIVQEDREMAEDYETLISEQIRKAQQLGHQALNQIYTQASFAGATTAQLDQLIEDYQDVLIRIKEGALAVAIYRLQNKSPMGFVTQEMIDSWIVILQSYVS